MMQRVKKLDVNHTKEISDQKELLEKKGHLIVIKMSMYQEDITNYTYVYIYIWFKISEAKTDRNKEINLHSLLETLTHFSQ